MFRAHGNRDNHTHTHTRTFIFIHKYVNTCWSGYLETEEQLVLVSPYGKFRPSPDDAIKTASKLEIFGDKRKFRININTHIFENVLKASEDYRHNKVPIHVCWNRVDSFKPSPGEFVLVRAESDGARGAAPASRA